MSIKSWAIFLVLTGLAAALFIVPVLSGPSVKLKALPADLATPADPAPAAVEVPGLETQGQQSPEDYDPAALATGICAGIVSRLYQVSLPTGFVAACTQTAQKQASAALRRCQHMECPSSEEIANRIRAELTKSLCSRLDSTSGCKIFVARAVQLEFTRL